MFRYFNSNFLFSWHQINWDQELLNAIRYHYLWSLISGEMKYRGNLSVCDAREYNRVMKKKEKKRTYLIFQTPFLTNGKNIIQVW